MLKGTVGEMEQALSGCPDDITQMKAIMESLTATVTSLRLNVMIWSPSRIVGVPDSCTTAIAALLKEAFGLENEPLLDRSHRSLQPKPKPSERLLLGLERPAPFGGASTDQSLRPVPLHLPRLYGKNCLGTSGI